MNDTEKNALERRIDELCQENERLRETISEINQLAVMSANVTRETQDRLRGDNAKLREQNDKMRKLLSSYWKAVHCPVTPTVPRDYLAEMSELGIEVPE